MEEACFCNMEDGFSLTSQKLGITRLSPGFSWSQYHELTENTSQSLNPKEKPVLIMHNSKRRSKYLTGNKKTGRYRYSSETGINFKVAGLNSF